MTAKFITSTRLQYSIPNDPDSKRHKESPVPLTDLNHYMIRVKNIDRTRDFYRDALALTQMERPNFPFPGYWLGRDDKIWVHMAQDGVPNAELFYRGSKPNAARDNSGVVDHIAFGAANPDEFRARFEQMKCDWWARSFPESKLFQMFVRDPDGLSIELNFFGLSPMPDWAENYAEMPRVV